jgi:hypothetical protein
MAGQWTLRAIRTRRNEWGHANLPSFAPPIRLISVLPRLSTSQARGQGRPCDAKSDSRRHPQTFNPTPVRCLSCSRANERPLSFLVDELEVEICTILESWREPDYIYFKAETEDGRVYDLRHHGYEDSWQMGVVEINPIKAAKSETPGAPSQPPNRSELWSRPK